METDSIIKHHQEHLNLIRAAIERGEAYLFIGAGFSQNAEPKSVQQEHFFKTWPQFIMQLAKKLWPYDSPDELKEKTAGEHLMIAQLFEEEFGKDVFYNELLKAVPYKDYLPSAIHREVITLNGIRNWKGIITTNQDTLIEQTLAAKHIHHDIIVSDLDISTKKAPLKVYKLHGTMEQPESIIFSEEQYRTYEEHHPLLHLKLKAIFAENVTVFVGFSLTDPNFKSIFGWVRDILQVSYQKKAYAFVFDKSIDDYTRRYWEKRNIILLPIPTKGFHDMGRAFINGMNQYIHYLTRELETKTFPIQNVNENEKALLSLLEEKEWNPIKTEKLIDYLHSLNKLKFIVPFQFQDFLKYTFPSLEQNEQLKVAQSLYPLVNPFFNVNDQPLIDVIIRLLKMDANLRDFDLLYSFMAKKAEGLYEMGNYGLISEFSLQVLSEYPDILVRYKNELLYWAVAAEKQRLNFTAIETYLTQIVIDWDEPKWLMRIASSFYFIGEHHMAINYYNRAIQAAEMKNDEWILYLSYLAKRQLFGSTFFYDNQYYSEAEEKHTNEMVKNLSSKLKETNNPFFAKWQEIGDLKSLWWTDYKNWKESLGPNTYGFNTLKGNSVGMIHELFWFYEHNGFPHTALMDKKFDVIPDIFAENNMQSDAAAIGVLLGFDKKLSTLFHFENVNLLSPLERKTIYEQSILISQNFRSYMMKHSANQRHPLLENWLKALLEVWKNMIPVFYDEEIATINEIVWELHKNLKSLKEIDHFKNIEAKLVNIFSHCTYFQMTETEPKRLKEWLSESLTHPNLTRAFASVHWEPLKGKLEVDSEMIRKLIHFQETGAHLIIRDWISEGILTKEQNEIIFKEVFASEQAKEVPKSLFVPFFKDKLEEIDILPAISDEIKQFQAHHSSSDANKLYNLSELAEEMNQEQINEIIKLAEEKIAYAHEERTGFLPVFTKNEITSAYLHLLSHLAYFGKIDKQEFLSKIRHFQKWDKSFATAFDKILSICDFETAAITDNLLNGLHSFDPSTLEDYAYLSGVWLMQSDSETQQKDGLFNQLLVLSRDTNIRVASEAIRGLARSIQNKNQQISPVHLQTILRNTENGVNRNHIGYLTNLAFLYNELRKSVKGNKEQEDKINEVRTALLHLPYANVRREIKFTEEL